MSGTDCESIALATALGPPPRVIRRPGRAVASLWHIGVALAFMGVTVPVWGFPIPLGALMFLSLSYGPALFVTMLWIGPILLFASAGFKAAVVRAVGAFAGLAVVCGWCLFVWNPQWIEWWSRASTAPLWIASIGLAVVSVLDIVRERRWARVVAGLCLRCGYDLRASGERCPECGAERVVAQPPPPPPTPRRTFRELWASRPWADIS